MKDLILSLMLAFAGHAVLAGVVDVPAGADAARIEAAIAGTRPGDEVRFAAGTYPITRAVCVTGKTNLVLRAAPGARFVLRFDATDRKRPGTDGFSFRHCADVRFEGGEFTTDRPVNCSGRVAAVDVKGHSYESDNVFENNRAPHDDAPAQKDVRLQNCTPIDVSTSSQIPFVDISGETNRHSFVARGTPTVYQGHPTTALLADGKTMFCVWPIGHGGHGGQLALSEDAGRHWRDVSERLPRLTHRFVNCPCLHRLVTPEGRERLIFWQNFIAPDEATARIRHVFNTDVAKDASTAMPAVCSDDGGKTWRLLSPLGERFRCILPFQGIVRLRDGSYLGVYHRGPVGCVDRGHLEVCASVTRDGGLTWSEPRVIAEDPRWDLCEPWVFRSPNGRELCCLIRENRRTGPSKVIYSRDEGATWTKPADLPWWLTGDRHQGVTLPDGRLVIVCRCQDRGSVLKNHFIAWVGTYEELVSGVPKGCHHVKLLHSYGEWDCGYPGIHLLPDGTVVATTYVKYAPGKDLQSVVTVRFNPVR